MIGTCATNLKAISQEIVSRSCYNLNSVFTNNHNVKIGAYLESGLLMPMGMHGDVQDVEPWIIRHKAVKKIQKSVRCRLRRNTLMRRITLKLHQKISFDDSMQLPVLSRKGSSTQCIATSVLSYDGIYCTKRHKEASCKEGA